MVVVVGVVVVSGVVGVGVVVVDVVVAGVVVVVDGVVGVVVVAGGVVEAGAGRFGYVGFPQQALGSAPSPVCGAWSNVIAISPASL